MSTQKAYFLSSALLLHLTYPTTAQADVTCDTEWEGDARDGSLSTAVAKTVAGDPGREVVVRAVASYFYYRTFEQGFESAVTSPGGSLEIGYRGRMGAVSFMASTGFEVRRDRWDDDEFVTTDWTSGPLFAAEVSTAYDETDFNLAASYTFAGAYSWVRGGLERPVLDLNEMTEAGLVLGWDVTAQGSEGHRSVDLGWILGLDLPAREASLRLRGGASHQSLGAEHAKWSGFLGAQLSLGARH